MTKQKPKQQQQQQAKQPLLLPCGRPVSDEEMQRVAYLAAANLQKLGAGHQDAAIDLATFQVADEHAQNCAKCRDQDPHPEKKRGKQR